MIGVGGVLDGRYELRRLIGAGGMGAVYLAFDRRLERDVAIKALLPQLAGERDLLARFMREARALAGVRHPNIVTLHDLLTLDEGLFLVMDLVPGHSLDDAIRREGPLSWERCADLGTQVCGGLAAIHARDVIHRDIKPSNILVEPSGVYRVADFGLVRMGGATQVTRTGAGMGTPGYWAPEQASGDSADARADLYSLGAVLYAAATGYPPIVGERDARAPDPRDLAPGLPPAAAEVVMRAMAPDPADRYGSAVEMALALRSSAGLPLSPVTPLPPAETLPPTERLPAADAPPRFEIEPPSEAEPPARRAAAPLAAGLALVVVAALAGLGLGSLRDAGGGERSVAGVGSIAVPAGWDTRPGARLAGTTLVEGLTAFPESGADGTLTVGATQAAGPTLLPARLRANAGRPDRVKLGDLDAYRYRDLSLAGDRLTVLVVPTTDGRVQTIACSAPAARFAAFAPRCEAVAGTLRLEGGIEASPLGPKEGYATAVGSAVTGVNAAVPDLRAELAAAALPAAQARAATGIGAAYSAAADALRDRRPGPEANGLNGALVARLDAAANAYAGLSAAAAAGDGPTYSAAREAVAGAEDAVRGALTALGQAGYEVTAP